MTFTHKIFKTKLNIWRFNDLKKASVGDCSKIISKYYATVWHANFLQENLGQSEINENVLKIMRIARFWRNKHRVKVPIEIQDLAVFICTFNFRDGDLVRVLQKLFSTLCLLINHYNFYFYELSEYHLYLVKNINEEHRATCMQKANSTYRKLVNNDPSDFDTGTITKFVKDDNQPKDGQTTINGDDTIMGDNYTEMSFTERGDNQSEVGFTQYGADGNSVIEESDGQGSAMKEEKINGHTIGHTVSESSEMKNELTTGKV